MLRKYINEYVLIVMTTMGLTAVQKTISFVANRASEQLNNVLCRAMLFTLYRRYNGCAQFHCISRTKSYIKWFY